MSKNILIVATSIKQVATHNLQTGAWLSTLARFIRVIEQNHYNYTIVSPEGGQVNIDPMSLGRLFAKAGDLEYYNREDFNNRLKNTPSIQEINPRNYDAMYFAGGFGSLIDYPNNEFLQDFVRIIYENDGVVAGVGHGISGLMNVVLSNGEYLVNGRQMTAFSNFEEFIKGTKRIVPFSIEDELKKRGAIYKKATLPFALFVVNDRRIITGQSPCASAAIAKEIVNILHNVTDNLKTANSVMIQDNSISMKPSC
jgi:putative intracellular protease/amidase